MIFRIIGRRLLLAVPTLIGVAFVAFLLVELMPGDPAAIMAGSEAPPSK